MQITKTQKKAPNPQLQTHAKWPFNTCEEAQLVFQLCLRKGHFSKLMTKWNKKKSCTEVCFSFWYRLPQRREQFVFATGDEHNLHHNLPRAELRVPLSAKTEQCLWLLQDNCFRSLNPRNPPAGAQISPFQVVMGCVQPRTHGTPTGSTALLQPSPCEPSAFGPILQQLLQ